MRAGGRACARILTFSRQTQSGDSVKLHGFRDSDVASLEETFATHVPDAPVSSGEAAVAGKNWGEVSVEGNQLTFRVGSKPAFHIDCADITGVSAAGKTDVLLEFAPDEGGERFARMLGVQ